MRACVSVFTNSRLSATQPNGCENVNNPKPNLNNQIKLNIASMLGHEGVVICRSHQDGSRALLFDTLLRLMKR